jgi:hypothetical protein
MLGRNGKARRSDTIGTVVTGRLSVIDQVSAWPKLTGSVGRCPTPSPIAWASARCQSDKQHASKGFGLFEESCMKSYFTAGLLGSAALLALAGRSQATVTNYTINDPYVAKGTIGISETTTTTATTFTNTFGPAPLTQTYFAIKFALTGLTGQDDTPNATNGNIGVTELSGTFTAVATAGNTGIAAMAVPGDSTQDGYTDGAGDNNGGNFASYLTSVQGGGPKSISSDFGSYTYVASDVSMPTVSSPTRGGVVGAGATADPDDNVATISGTATTLQGTWSEGGGSDIAIGKTFATIFVTANTDVNFTGLIADFGTTAQGTPSGTFGASLSTPEPGTIGLISVGLMGLLARRRRRA